MELLQKIVKAFQGEHSYPAPLVDRAKIHHVVCMVCGKVEAGNDRMCPGCREMRRRLREEHPYHLMGF